MKCQRRSQGKHHSNRPRSGARHGPEDEGDQLHSGKGLATIQVSKSTAAAHSAVGGREAEGRAPPQGSTGPVATDGHTKLLQEECVVPTGLSPLACGSCTGDRAEDLGRRRIPGASGFCDDRDEVDALFRAELGGVAVGRLDRRIGSRRATTCLAGLGEGLDPLKASDGQIQCRRRALQARQVNVSRPPPLHPAIVRPFRLQASSCTPRSQKISHSVVSLSALSTGGTHPGVERAAIQDGIALRAPSVFRGIGDSKAMADFDIEGSRLQAAPPVRHSREKGTSTLAGLGPKQGLHSRARGLKVGVPAGLVKESGEVVLGLGQGDRRGQGLGQMAVEVGERQLHCWRGGEPSRTKATIELHAAGHAGTKGGKVGRRGIYSSGPKSKTRFTKGAGSLTPLGAVKMQPGEASKTATHPRVEVHEGRHLRGGRAAPHVVEQACVPRAWTEQPQTHLRVLQVRKRLKQLRGSTDPRQDMAPHEISIPNGSTKETQIAL